MTYFWRVTGVYLLGVLLCSVLLAALGFAHEMYFHKAMPSGVSAVGLLVPAMLAGQSFVKRIGERPEGREVWGFSLWFTVIQSVIAVVFILTIGLLQSSEIVELMQKENFTTFALILMVGIFLLILIASRLGLGLGVRTGLKAMERAVRR
jgi:hypothetical protein